MGHGALVLSVRVASRREAEVLGMSYSPCPPHPPCPRLPIPYLA